MLLVMRMLVLSVGGGSLVKGLEHKKEAEGAEERETLGVPCCSLQLPEGRLW